MKAGSSLQAASCVGFALVFAAVLAPLPVLAAAVEKRCSDLGANCVCSEPLDTTSAVHSGGDFDPSDSEGTGAKECGGSTRFMDGVNNEVSWVPETGMPSGNTVSNVMHVNQLINGPGGCSGCTSSIHGYGNPDAIKSSTRRMCIRHYEQYSDDWQGGADKCNNKIMAWSYSGNFSPGLFSDYVNKYGREAVISSATPKPAGNDIRYPDADADTQATILNAPSSYDCRVGSNRWCRIEECLSGDVLHATSLSLDVFVDTTDGAKSYHKINAPIAGGTSRTMDTLWLLNIYRERYPSNPNCAGTRSYSHAMQAQWDTAAGQTIGPAFEIEGGGGGSTPPPPPTAPPAPVLLNP